MFWRLGFISAWRNRARSILAILSMALAAGFMTNAISLSRGYTAEHTMGYRSLTGGEISAYSLPLNATTSMEGEIWLYQELSGVENTDLSLTLSELERNGYLSSQLQRTAFSPQDIAAIAEAAQINAVYPRYQMPALSSGKTGQWYTPLRGRDLSLDAWTKIADFVQDGRWLLAEDEGQLVCVISAEQHYPTGQWMYGLGDIVHLQVPRILPGNQYTPFYDYNDPLLVELKIVGLLDLPSRLILRAEGGVQLYMQNDEIQLPLGTWKRIWQEAGGEEYLPQQLALQVEDLSYLEDIASDLQLSFPGFAFFTVNQLAERSQASFLDEQISKAALSAALAEAMLRSSHEEQPVIALDLRLPLILLIFINAALVIASNLLIMVSERRTEIGILKAVGSTRLQVVQMVLSEAILISVFGSLIGFVIFRLPALFNQMTNSVLASILVRDVTWDLVMVLMVATVSSLVFGMLPALTMANLSVREVLQTE